MVAEMSEPISNVRNAPRGLSPLLVDRILSLFDTLGDRPDASSQASSNMGARIRLGAPSPAERPPVPPTPLGATAQALAFLRANGVSVSVAESSVFGTRWWVSGHGEALDSNGLVAAARAKGFTA
jgi:hypothetical protein